jgi:hypothetical protein
MLETQQKREKHRHLIIETKEWSCPALPLHEGQVGCEEKSIIVSANEALPSKCKLQQNIKIHGLCVLGSECLDKSSCLVAKAALGRCVGPNSICHFGPEAKIHKDSKILL